MTDYALSGSGQPVEAAGDEAVEILEPASFSRFFEAEWPKLRNYLGRFVGGDEAEELAQEAFARVYSAKGEIKSSPSGFLYQTARNLLVDSQRRHNRRCDVLVEGADAEAIADPHASPEDQADWRQRLENAAAMLDHMSPRGREIFLLQVVDGCSYAEIAARMNMSLPGVKKQLMRAFEICAKHAESEMKRSRRGVQKRRPEKV